MSQKIAVILFNLGGPDKLKSIKPFLFNFFMDENIISAPKPIRYFIAKWIAHTRSKGAALEAYSKIGGASPILENTMLQRQALERSLNIGFDGEIKCFVSMRYWHPQSDQIAREVAEYNPDKVILVPLYPQFSTTTTYSSFQDWNKTCKKIGFKPDTTSLCCYALDDGFVKPSADLVNYSYKKTQRENPNTPIRLLFSAHGLPGKIIEDGDPYQWQCQESARLIAEATGLENLDWEICYQSRVGRLKWIEPSTDQALEKAARDGVGVLIYPHAFVSEHVETLVEIEDEYREKSNDLGIPFFERVPTVSTHPQFITGLKSLILDMLDKSGTVSYKGAPICPPEFKNCCQRKAL